MSFLKSSTGPWILAIILSIIIFFNFFVPGTIVGDVSETLYNWTLIASSVAVGVGLLNIVLHAFREVKGKRAGKWPFAIFQIFIIAVLLISGFGEGSRSTTMGPGSPQTIIKWLNMNWYFFGEYAAAAISGLWVVTASYRAFKVRSVDSALFLFGAAMLMLKFAPVGGSIWIGFPIIGGWIQNTFYDAVVKALTISMGLGTLIYAFRFYIGQERRPFGMAE